LPCNLLVITNPHAWVKEYGSLKCGAHLESALYLARRCFLTSSSLFYSSPPPLTRRQLA
jgi:hypothetical protein